MSYKGQLSNAFPKDVLKKS